MRAGWWQVGLGNVCSLARHLLEVSARSHRRGTSGDRTASPAKVVVGVARRNGLPTARNHRITATVGCTLKRVVEIKKATIDRAKFNRGLSLPYQLRLADFEMAMQDIYDFFYDVNTYLLEKGLQRLDDMLRPANLSGTLSDMLTDAVAKHSRILVINHFHNGHPDLIVQDRYPNNMVKAGEDGVEIKSTRKRGGAVDTHGARNQTLCTFVYEVDNDRSKPAQEREPLAFREIYIGQVTEADFRRNPRGELGTRTATLDAAGIARFREGWVYKDLPPTVTARLGSRGSWRS